MTIHLCHEGRKLGAFSTEQVEAMFKGGVITNDTLAWTAGLAEWKKLREVLAPPAPPPIPQPVRPSTPIEMANASSIPPIIPAPPAKDFNRNPETIGREQRKMSGNTKLGIWCILAWIGAIIFIGAFVSVSTGLSGRGLSNRDAKLQDNGTIPPDPEMVTAYAHTFSGGPALLFLVIGLRGIARKASATVLAKRQWTFHNFGRDVYLPAVWGTLWRSAIPVLCSAGFFAFALDEPVAKVQAFVTTIFLWILAFPFTLDRPLWYKSQIGRLSQAMPRGSNIVAPRIQSTTSGNSKWIFALGCIALAILVVTSLGVFALIRQKTSRIAEATDDRGDLPSNAVTVPAQPASDETMEANSETEPQLKRLGDLFPSITRYGNPQHAVKWKSIDPTAKYDSPFQFIERAGTEFHAPPSDIVVPVYPPGVGMVKQAQSPTARVGRERDSVLHITDTRLGACIVWVGRTNADSASDLLCAHYAVLAACGIADQNDHKYKYLEICEGGGWRKSELTGGSLVYFPVLFYAQKPASDSSTIRSVEEIRNRATKHLELLLNFFDAASAEEAKHSARDVSKH